ncbi:cryptochrome/photolyase family protein [Alteromonas aestuariivivens]|uniref:Cryptochrome/photolyase family protein n=1 Tax=Alteromonas aestuariivivens TaxID=1938339 RepID=A0A3D8M8D5_9ALTE|nr:cryptochrome/photolyase family protein [Alteromonas aestuariivivens]RDV25958.1 cryptochrome/photolyase family protein [Alteromonas aestuariivivens]
MAGTLFLLLGDQLTESLEMFQCINKNTDAVLMAEVKQEATYVHHHKKKIVLLFSAMRHFARQLENSGIEVIYRTYDCADNQGSLQGEVMRQLKLRDWGRVVVTEPGEHRLLISMQQWSSMLGVAVEILPDTRFICSRQGFADWAEGRKQLRMEFFYREMRRQTGVLMEGTRPVGGKWNYDQQNREPMPANVAVPKPTIFQPDPVTKEVIALVKAHFPDHFGELERFGFAVTREQALTVLNTFIQERLPDFGRYQDAMREGDPWLFHSHLSFYLNCGLLTPREVVSQAEAAYHAGQVPLNSAEGFIRQVLGWREFVRGFYWYFMPDLASQNYFSAQRPLPEFFWTGHTNMNCLRQCIQDTRKHAYAHHIQRLMVIGNFSLLAELSPQAVQEWYLLVYADAYEWVELPNVASMILYADGGKLASKPYIASGSYINKMSDYCSNCGYSVAKKTGPSACPFNYLYWQFVARHADKLASNPRMQLIYNSFYRMDDSKRSAVEQSCAEFLQKLEKNDV